MFGQQSPNHSPNDDNDHDYGGERHTYGPVRYHAASFSFRKFLELVKLWLLGHFCRRGCVDLVVALVGEAPGGLP